MSCVGNFISVCEEEQLVYKNDGYKMWFDMWSNHFDEGIIGEGGEAVNDDDNSVVWFKVYPKGSDEHKPEIAKLYLEIMGVRKYKIISAGGISSVSISSTE